jgi:predicted secreted protein
MKQLSKIMLAAVASVAIAAPAFAWDFSASGSSSATFKQQTITPATGDATTQANVTSLGSGVTVSSSNTDGANSATFSYSAGWNDDGKNFDESVSISGSKKVGNWTASSSTSAHMQKDATGGGSTQSGSNTGSTPQNARPSAVITLTDGSITYKLGDASHLSTAEKTSSGPMDGTQDAEASVDSFNGFSVGLGVGPGTLTVALQMASTGSAAGTAGSGDASYFGEGNGGGAALDCGAQKTGFGLNFAGDVGADLTFTYGSGSSAASSRCVDNASSNSATYSVMGLGVAIPVGGMTIAIDYGSNAALWTIAEVEGGSAKAGWELSLTMPVGDATAGVNLSSTASITTTAGVAGDAAVTGGTELWYTVPIGAVSLSAGYGSSAVVDGTATTQMGAEMSMSF